MPFCPFYCMVPLVKLNNRKQDTLIIQGSLRNLVSVREKLRSSTQQHLHLDRVGRKVEAWGPCICSANDNCIWAFGNLGESKYGVSFLGYPSNRRPPFHENPKKPREAYKRRALGMEKVCPKYFEKSTALQKARHRRRRQGRPLSSITGSRRDLRSYRMKYTWI